MEKKVTVVGAGLGGLSTAIHLACQGFQVKVFEKNQRPGGKVNTITDGSYYFDTGPTLLTMPFVIDNLFDSAGSPRTESLQFAPMEPICRYFWLDGSVLDASSDPEKMAREISKLSRSDGENYQNFLSYTKRIYDITANIFLFTPIHELNILLKQLRLSQVLKFYQIDSLRTMHQSIAGIFKNPKIIQLFDRYATYNGSDPFQAPATLNIISYVEFGLGGFYVQGGMYQLVKALVNLAENLGVKIFTNTYVDKIVHSNRKVKGIRCAGQHVPADYVICNADVVVAHNELIDGYEHHRRRLNRLEPSLSGLVFLWGISEQHPQLAHHNIIFSSDYHQEFRQIFKEQRAPDDPTVYIAISSKTDPHHAPSGGENWFVLVNMPYLAPAQNWDAAIDATREAIFTKLEKLGLKIKNRIETERVFGPLDFSNIYNSNRGSIYGISSNSRMTAFRRPANKSRQISGLYFTGGSTHPGGGIPLVLASGKMVADLINLNEKKKV